MRKLGIIEDDQELVKLIKDYLGKQGEYSVLWATNSADEGLKLLREQSVDLVLLDLVLQGKDGLSVLEEMAEMPNKPACIVFSGMGQEHVMRKTAEKGADYFLLKPIFLDVLVRRMNDVMEGKGIRKQPPIKNVGPVITAQALALGGGGEPTKSDPESFVRDVLHSMGIPRTLGGHTYLKTAVRLSVDDFTYLTGGITKRLYPAIAKEHNVSHTQVERGIRHVLVRTWTKSAGQEWSRLMGKGDETCEKPTNGEFISALVDLYQATQK